MELASTGSVGESMPATAIVASSECLVCARPLRRHAPRLTYGRAVCSEDEDAKEKAAAAAVSLSKRERIRVQREGLPAFAYKDEFVKAVFEHQVLIIVAETGAGKTTQLPQYLLEAGFGEAGALSTLV